MKTVNYLRLVLRELLFYVFTFSIIVPIYRAYKNPVKLYQLPFLYGVACVVFILPTLYTAMNDTYILTDTAYNSYTINAIICFWSAILGYNMVKLPKKNRGYQLNIYDEKKMALVAAFFLLIGVFASLQIDPTTFGSETGGVFAITLFFSRFMRPAAIIIFILYLKKPDIKKVILLLLWIGITLQFILISGRRSDIFILAITIVFPLYFIKGIILPRKLLLPALLFAYAVIVIVPVIREYTKAGNFSEIQNVAIEENFSMYLSGESTNEIIEAASNMEIISKSGEYSFGVSFINHFIHQYFSSTLFGKDFKESFKLNTVDLASLREEYWNYKIGTFKNYLADTGFAISFYDFGYFAGIIFFLFGALTKKIYLKIYETYDLSWIIFYCFFIVFILMSIYSQINIIPTFLVPYLIVLLTATFFSRRKIDINTIDQLPKKYIYLG